MSWLSPSCRGQSRRDSDPLFQRPPARVPQKGHVFHSSWRGCLQLMQLRLRSVSQNGQTTKSYWTILEQAGKIDSVLIDTSITRSNCSSAVMSALAFVTPASPKGLICAE